MEIGLVINDISSKVDGVKIPIGKQISIDKGDMLLDEIDVKSGEEIITVSYVIYDNTTEKELDSNEIELDGTYQGLHSIYQNKLSDKNSIGNAKEYLTNLHVFNTIKEPLAENIEIREKARRELEQQREIELQQQAEEEEQDRQREAELQRQAEEEARQRQAEIERQAEEEKQKQAELQHQAEEKAKQREVELQRQAKEEARQRQAEIERQAEEKAKQREAELQKQAKLKQLREQDETRVNNTKTKAESQKNLLEESSSKSNPFKNKKVLMFSGIGSAIAIIGISGTLFFGGQTSETTSATTKSDESLSVLIDKKDYLQAGAKYPKQYEKIEQSIIDNMKDETIRKDLESLEKFNDKYPTANGNIDMAFFKKDWKEIVRVYEKYQDHIDLNENRKMMLGYGYFKTRDSNNDHLAKAEKISNELKDKGLKNKIADNQIAQATIDNLTNEIEKSNLSPEEKEQKMKTKEAVIQKQKEL
ncbi:hypothetical protein CN895_08095 [Bacillus cereus]|uniref:cell envelope integrity protein TolA n=1 Tax=Bacillus cereus TaxID=1396 RepID=UPI000BFBF2A7|nr:cell envelope integrity protein TolA [Bacillus cereus]PGK15300.1 hypothetical protein CN895_08095 [Bacillus cereus]